MAFPVDLKRMPGHVPPSRIRYEKKNPMVSVRLTESLRKTLDGLKKKEDLSYADLVKRGLRASANEQTAYKRGWDAAKRETVSIGVCSRCGKPISWSLNREAHRLLLAKAVNSMRLIHGECKDR